MKKSIATLLAVSFLCSTALCAEEDISILAQETDALYRHGAGAKDGAYTALSTSMLGWGIGLFAGIAILACVLHQSTAGHAH